MNKKLATSVGAVAIVGAAVALTAGTYSYFHAEQTVGPQTVHAGTLGLGLGSVNTQVNTLDLSNAAPGETYQGTFSVFNTGTIDGNLSFDITGDAGALGNALIVEVDDPSNHQIVAPRPANSILNTTYQAGILPGTHDARTYTLKVTFDPNAENDFQNAAAKFSVDASLVQVHS